MSEQRAFSAAIFRRGQKQELFDAGPKADGEEGWDDKAELQQKLGDLQALWAAARTGRDLGAAIWRPGPGVAEVVLARGKLFNHMGYTQGSKLYLHIEEAVYLVDRANLLLFLEPAAPHEQQRLLSLQEAYDLMVSCGISTEQYLVYCKLTRAGYIVQRYPARWTLKITESPRTIWQRWYPRQEGPGAAGPSGAAPQPQQAQQAQQAAGPAGPPASGAAALAGASSKKKRKRDEAAARHGSWWQAGGSNLPWLQGLPSDFLDSLPRCEVAPDSRAKWAADFPAMVPLTAIPDAELFAERAGADSDLLDFDVYEPNAKFGRKTAGAPAFRVVVRAPEGSPCVHDFPGLELLAAVDRASPGIPVKFASVEDGDIGFYGIGLVELRSIL